MSTQIDTISLTKKIDAYYRGERISNAALFVIGGGAITWTFLLFLWRQGHLSSGFFFAALPLGLFFMITGAYRFVRTFKRYEHAITSIDDQIFQQNEMKKLEDRLSRFRKKRNVSTLICIVSLFGCVITSLSNLNHIIVGSCMSITVFSALLLVFDLFGQFRVEEYMHFLRKAL